MRLLMIEDEADFAAQVKAAFEATTPCTFMSSSDIGLHHHDFFDNESALEEQLLKRLHGLQKEHAFDLVLLDSDLSRVRNGLSQSMCRNAFQRLGVPVCRYKKKHSTTELARYQDLKRLAVEGASAIWVPSELLKGRTALSSGLVPWLHAVAAGFDWIRERLRNSDRDSTRTLGPADLLALLLERPGLRGDLLGYTAQNLFFFGAPIGDDEMGDDTALFDQIEATRIGYWLLNCIIAFPGPILVPAAAAAYLNLKVESFALEPVQRLIASARYQGPFADVSGGLFWRDELGRLLDGWGGDIAAAGEVGGVELKRVDSTDVGSAAYYCLVTQQPISADEAAMNPDWIPVGAQLARIRQESFEKLGPMLGM